jgi:hypothetical protein
LEGEYSGVGGRAHKGLPIEVAQDVSVMTRAGVQDNRYLLAESQPGFRVTSYQAEPYAVRLREDQKKSQSLPLLPAEAKASNDSTTSLPTKPVLVPVSASLGAGTA